ncbi:F-box/WD repeat-containing protein 7-like [Xenopus laevis]|uniref:F-box/WD repeat-containing protein 7-like n=1 Tax=Xenopus laevis TaxID=8355 RepID=A0A8J1MUS0_XENLA|nr:F-box/WD repeat-containing protein 7-like [Xenopus laevis]
MGCASQSRVEASEDYVCQLADELALRILWYLDGKEILQVAQTCRRWRQLAEDEGLWQGKCKAEGIEEPLCITRRKAKASRSGPWKSSYIYQLSGDTNWPPRENQRNHIGYVGYQFHNLDLLMGRIWFVWELKEQYKSGRQLVENI